MDKTQAENLINCDTVKDFIDICPHCDARAHFEMLFNQSYSNKKGDLVFYVIFRCVPCKKLILETYKFRQNEYSRSIDLEPSGWEDKFPTNNLAYVNKFEETVPKIILDDFKEGLISLNNNCYKAAVSMFRRSLQSSLLDLGAKPDEDLIIQIKDINGLTQDIKDWAHNIRIFGNWGAHPQDDNLKEVDSDIANEVKMFIEEFFNYVYVMPARVSKARFVNSKKEETDEDENIDS